MYKYIMFDLDGTLTDSSEGITKCVQYALDMFGFENQPMEKLLKFIGPPLVDSFMAFFGLSEEDARKATAKYRERFAPIGIYENKLYEGIPEGLDVLKNAGFCLCVASSKPEPFVKRILEYFEIDGFFDVVKGASLDGKIHTKDQVIEAVMADLPHGFAKSELVMVGDRLHDVEGAACFGLDCIGVSFGFGGREELETAGAVYVVDSMKELTEYLTK